VVAVAHHKVFKRQLGGLSLLKGRMKPGAFEGEDLKLTVLRKNKPVIDSAMPRLASERGRAARSHAVIKPADNIVGGPDSGPSQAGWPRRQPSAAPPR
jgi:hypothetical protein